MGSSSYADLSEKNEKNATDVADKMAQSVDTKPENSISAALPSASTVKDPPAEQQTTSA
jgi:hypothetical protein